MLLGQGVINIDFCSTCHVRHNIHSMHCAWIMIIFQQSDSSKDSGSAKKKGKTGGGGYKRGK